MAKYRRYSMAFKRQVAEEYVSGQATLYGLGRRYDICPRLVRNWVDKYESGAFDEAAETAAAAPEYEARLAALERKVGQLTLENEFLKKALASSRRQRVARSSVVSGPRVSRSPKDAGS